MKANENLLRKCLERARVDFEKGQIKIQPYSGQPVPEKWLSDVWSGLMSEISIALQIPLFEYYEFSCGSYDVRSSCSKLKSGLTLQFLSYGDYREKYYAIFNAELTRKKNTKDGSQGQRYKNPRQFRVTGKGSAFFQFWDRTALPHPKLSSYYEYMGNLKPLVFTAQVRKDNKLANATIIPLTISDEELRRRIGL